MAARTNSKNVAAKTVEVAGPSWASALAAGRPKAAEFRDRTEAQAKANGWKAERTATGTVFKRGRTEEITVRYSAGDFIQEARAKGTEKPIVIPGMADKMAKLDKALAAPKPPVVKK